MTRSVQWFLVSLIGVLGADHPTTSPDEVQAEPDSDGFVETFVLTPIRLDAFSMDVPAAIFGPKTNNTCHDWESQSQSCYLPADVRTSHQPDAVPGTAQLIERHLSSWLETWRTGAWPTDGGTITFSLKQYLSLEHLWLAQRIEVSERITGYWLDGRNPPAETLQKATNQPAEELEVEFFTGVQDGPGYPIKTKL